MMDLTPTQRRVLAAYRADERASLADVAKKLGVVKTTVRYTVSALAAKGLLRYTTRSARSVEVVGRKRPAACWPDPPRPLKPFPQAILDAYRADPRTSMDEIARRLGRSKSGVYGQVQNLVKLGLLRRLPHYERGYEPVRLVKRSNNTNV
jgi:DNA-binding IclR family transcriptional regulator